MNREITIISQILNNYRGGKNKRLQKIHISQKSGIFVIVFKFIEEFKKKSWKTFFFYENFAYNVNNLLTFSKDNQGFSQCEIVSLIKKSSD